MKKNQLWMAGLLALATGLVAAHAEMETSGNVGASLTDGNSETLVANASLISEAGDDVNKIVLGIEGNYGETGDATTVENAKAYAKYRNVFSDPFYAYVNGDLLYDDIAGIDSRLVAGPGLGTFLMKDEASELGVEAGAVYIREELVGLEDVTAEDGSVSRMEVKTEDDVIALRLAQNYARELSETSRVWQNVEYLPEFEDFDNYLLNAELGIEADVTETTALRFVVQDRYDSTPAAGRERNDLSVIAGLSFKL